MKRREFLQTTALGIASGMLSRPSWAASSGLVAQEIPEGVVLKWSKPGAVKLLRSFLPLTAESLEDPRLPLTVVEQGNRLAAGQFVDKNVAQGINYSYMLKYPDGTFLNAKCWSNDSPIAAPVLRTVQRPMVRVDKSNYTLEVIEGNKLIRRFAINLGRLPKVRKLNQDRSSTPEGRYRLGSIYHRHQFHKAIDLNYPNSADRARHSLLDPGLPIGGEIQIHGEGLGRNFTFGCVAVDNGNIDEFLSIPTLRDATCWIYGGELQLADLESDQHHQGHSAYEIGRLQMQNGLKVTCLWDVATRRALGD